MAKYLSPIIFVVICIQSAIALSARCKGKELEILSVEVSGREFYENGETIEVQCKNQFEKSSEHNIRCHDGDWNITTLPCKPASCRYPPPVIDNAEVSVSSREHGTEVNYRCFPPFELMSIIPITCFYGQWLGKLPTCKDTRCYTNNLFQFNGIKEEIKTVNDQEFYTPSCLDGYDNLEVELRCSKGKWQSNVNHPIFCKPGNCIVPYVVYGDFYLLKIKRTGLLFERSIRTFEKVKTNSFAKHNSDLYFRCGHGRKFQGKNETTKDGTKVTCNMKQWVPKPECLYSHCKVKELENFHVDVSGKEFYASGEAIDVRCRNQFEKSSNHNIHCFNGQWQITTPPCKSASCRYPPPVIDGAVADISSGEHGTKVDYRCFPPYEIESRIPITCSYGQWLGELPTCKDTRCHTNNLFQYHGVQVENKRFNDQQFYTPSCLYGYDNLEIELRCNKGNWQREEKAPIFCEPGNCIVPFVAYGDFYLLKIKRTGIVFTENIRTFEKITTNSFVKHKSDLYFRCRHGRKFQGKNETTGDGIKVTCNMKQLVPKPECSYVPQSIMIAPTTTDQPIEIHFDINETKALRVEDTVNNETDEDQRNHTEIEIISEINNSSRNCEYKNSDPHLLVFFDDQVTEADSLPHGSDIKFGCRPVGMLRLRGPASVNCNDGEWEPTNFPKCVSPVKETDVVIIFSGEKTYDVYPEDVVAVVEHNRIDIICYQVNRRSWPRLYPNGINKNISGRNTLSDHGVALTLITIEDMTEEYSGAYTCSSDLDSRSISVFVKGSDGSLNILCPRVNVTDHLSIAYDPPSRRILPGTVAYFSCKDEMWELKGMHIVTCLKTGKWSFDAPVCVRSLDILCPRINTTNHLSIAYHPPSHKILPSTTAYFSCTDVMWELEGIHSVTCLKTGKWSFHPPICVRSLDNLCPRLNATDQLSIAYDPPSRMILPGTAAYFSCMDAMWELKGIPSVTCLSTGKWSLDSPICVRSLDILCPRVYATAHLSIAYDPPSHWILPGSTAYFSCMDAMWELKGIQRITCLNTGKWSFDAPVCVRKCWPIPEIEHGYTEGDLFDVGSEIIFTCHKGYQLTGAGKTTCQEDGLLSNTPPLCSEDSTRCFSQDLLSILPEGVFGSNITTGYMSSGSVVELICLDNFLAMPGDTYAVCTSKGHWKVDDIQCVPGCYAVEKLHNSTLIIEEIKDIYRYGENLAFSCPENQELSIELESIICLATGWSDDRVPTCLPQKLDFNVTTA